MLVTTSILYVYRRIKFASKRRRRRRRTERQTAARNALRLHIVKSNECAQRRRRRSTAAAVAAISRVRYSLRGRIGAFVLSSGVLVEIGFVLFRLSRRYFIGKHRFTGTCEVCRYYNYYACVFVVLCFPKSGLSE